jgi:hypothetical protein
MRPKIRCDSYCANFFGTFHQRSKAWQGQQKCKCVDERRMKHKSCSLNPYNNDNACFGRPSVRSVRARNDQEKKEVRSCSQAGTYLSFPRVNALECTATYLLARRGSVHALCLEREGLTLGLRKRSAGSTAACVVCCSLDGWPLTAKCWPKISWAPWPVIPTREASLRRERGGGRNSDLRVTPWRRALYVSCVCFIWILHVFSSRCCICCNGYTRMLQVYVSNV